ncbi:hypothetical protein [Permianibacter aggregans]|uniref:Uncharacterized protein n=1 Tax=Permianibacter aggregans TaxID=1510150 RepID=A0A4R6UTE2_9GAMM|nr:hypothetical protein [Permianibacter aggregans]TDQ49129.1 hypothetical protein EV696_105103 [Permianibacter aggregans]
MSLLPPILLRRLAPRKRLFPTLFLSTGLALFASSAAAAELHCEQLLTPADLHNALGEKARAIVSKPSGVVQETGGRCSRLFAMGQFDRFSDELILMVSPANSVDSAKATVERMANDAKKYFGFSRPAIGDNAVHYRRLDPLNDARMGMHIHFSVGKYVVELTYHNVDDGKRNKFVIESKELEPLATLLAKRLR